MSGAQDIANLFKVASKSIMDVGKETLEQAKERCKAAEEVMQEPGSGLSKRTISKVKTELRSTVPKKIPRTTISNQPKITPVRKMTKDSKTRPKKSNPSTSPNSKTPAEDLPVPPPSPKECKKGQDCTEPQLPTDSSSDESLSDLPEPTFPEFTKDRGIDESHTLGVIKSQINNTLAKVYANGLYSIHDDFNNMDKLKDSYSIDQISSVKRMWWLDRWDHLVEPPTWLVPGLFTVAIPPETSNRVARSACSDAREAMGSVTYLNEMDV